MTLLIAVDDMIGVASSYVAGLSVSLLPGGTVGRRWEVAAKIKTGSKPKEVIDLGSDVK